MKKCRRIELFCLMAIWMLVMTPSISAIQYKIEYPTDSENDKEQKWANEDSLETTPIPYPWFLRRFILAVYEYRLAKVEFWKNLAGISYGCRGQIYYERLIPYIIFSIACLRLEIWQILWNSKLVYEVNYH